VSRRRIAIATPYSEGSILAIARAAARHDRLHRFYTTWYEGPGRGFSGRIPETLARFLPKELAGRSFPGIPAERVETSGELWELLRMTLMRLPHAKPLASRTMYRAKHRFDSAVARKLRTECADAVVAMFASAERTLAEAKASGAIGALNFVNSHPRYRNELLMSVAGLRHGHHELIAPEVEWRVDGELQNAACVLVPSKFVGDQLRAVGVPGDAIVVCRYGVDKSAFRPTEEVQHATRNRRGRLDCLFVGQIGYRKGIPVLIEAARLLATKPVVFELVGPAVSADVLRAAPENVVWRGPSTHSSVAAKMREADVFVLPSLEDAYSLVVLEAMASGLPVITTDHTGASEVIRDGHDGLIVQAGNPRALADAVERLPDDVDLRRRMAISARERAAAEDSWDEYGDRILGAIDEWWPES
jgi:glycosyltransferase involved in cell wall biosynthesis